MVHYVIDEDTYRKIEQDIGTPPKTVMTLADPAVCTPAQADSIVRSKLTKLLKLANFSGLGKKKGDSISIDRYGNISIPPIGFVNEGNRGLLACYARQQRVVAVCKSYLPSKRLNLKNESVLLQYRITRSLLHYLGNKRTRNPFTEEELTFIEESFTPSPHHSRLEELKNTRDIERLMVSHRLYLIKTSRCIRQYNKESFRRSVSNRVSSMVNKRVRTDKENLFEYLDTSRFTDLASIKAALVVNIRLLEDRKPAGDPALTMVVLEENADRIKELLGLVYSSRTRSWLATTEDGITVSVLPVKDNRNGYSEFIFWASLDDSLYEV